MFRHRFVIHLTDIALMSQTKAALEAVDGIAKVNAHLEYAKTFVTIRNVVSVISLVLIVILVFVSIFIMSNTIKLCYLRPARRDRDNEDGRRDEQLSGCRLWSRVLYCGILGGGLASSAEWGIISLVTGKLVESVTGSFITFVPFQRGRNEVFIVYMAVGILVGAFGGVNAIRNYLKV